MNTIPKAPGSIFEKTGFVFYTPRVNTILVFSLLTILPVLSQSFPAMGKGIFVPNCFAS